MITLLLAWMTMSMVFPDKSEKETYEDAIYGKIRKAQEEKAKEARCLARNAWFETQNTRSLTACVDKAFDCVWNILERFGVKP